MIARNPAEFRRYAATVAVFATGLYAALLIASFGFIALLANVDVLPSGTAQFTAAIATASAVAVVLAETLSIALRVPREAQRVAVARSLLDGVSALAAFALVAGVVEMLASGDALRGLFLLQAVVLGPIGATTGIAAAVIMILFTLVLASGVGEKGSPQWPWEKDDE